MSPKLFQNLFVRVENFCVPEKCLKYMILKLKCLYGLETPVFIRIKLPHQKI